MIEKYKCYEFEVRKLPSHNDGSMKRSFYDYVIFDPDPTLCERKVICSAESWFDTEQEARFAAIGHICLIEQGDS